MAKDAFNSWFHKETLPSGSGRPNKGRRASAIITACPTDSIQSTADTSTDDSHIAVTRLNSLAGMSNSKVTGTSGSGVKKT